jgi:putative tricarboxylic transport membrane protein
VIEKRTSWHPQREIEIVAGTPEGGGLDRTARALAKSLAATGITNVPLKVTNMPGDGSRKIWTYLDRYAADPHVLVVSSPNVTTDNLTGVSALDHDNYTPLAILHNEYIAFVVRSDSRLADSTLLLDRLGADPGSISVAVATSLGNPNHIALAQVTRHAGGHVQRLRVRAFDSARHAVADVMAGGCDVGAISAASAVPELESGSLRPLAVSATERLAGLYAQTPTWIEQGVDCAIGAWRGINGARGLGTEQISFWDQALAAATSTSEWQSEIARNYWSAMYVGSADLRKRLPGERAHMSAVLSDLGLLR